MPHFSDCKETILSLKGRETRLFDQRYLEILRQKPQNDVKRLKSHINNRLDCFANARNGIVIAPPLWRRQGGELYHHFGEEKSEGLYANRYLGSPQIFACKAKTYEHITLISCKRSGAAGNAVMSVFFFSVHFSFCVAIKKKSELLVKNYRNFR